MRLFDGLPIPRQAVAEEIAHFLRESMAAAPIHVHGPEGYGKRSLVRALAASLKGGGRPVATISLHDADGQSLPEILNIRLLRALGRELSDPPVAVEIEPGASADLGSAALTALKSLAASTAGERPVFIVECAEWLWLADDFRAGFLRYYGEEPDLRGFDLVTLSAFSGRTLCIRDRVEERALLPFAVAGNSSNPFADKAAAEVEDDACLDEIRSWIESRRAKAGRTMVLSRVSADDLMPIARDCIARYGGHPGLSMAAIDQLLRESERHEAASMPPPVKIFENQLLSWVEAADELREKLFPQLMFPESLPQSLCSTIPHQLKLLSAELEGSGGDGTNPGTEEVWFGLGLRRRGLPGERPQDGFPQMPTWVTPDWLSSRADALLARAREAEERYARRAKEDDPHLATVEREVRRFLCQGGDDGKDRRKGGYSLLDLETRVVESEVQYKLTLRRELQNGSAGAHIGGDKRHRKSRRPVFTRETLHVFRNFAGTGERLWSQHNAMLRRLSAAGNPALPQVYYGGRITSEGEGNSDEKAMGYLLLHDLGPSLENRFGAIQESLTKRQGGDEAKPVEAAVRAAELTRALSLLHSKGYAHRRIALDAIRISSTGDQTYLVLSGFEFALILDTLALARGGTRGVRYEEGILPRKLPFCSLDRLRVIAEGGDENGFGVVTWAETDVHAMCVLLCYLFTGELDSERLDALRGELPRNADDAAKRERACAALSDSIRGALLDEGRWTKAKKDHGKPYRAFLDQMRELVERGLSSEQPVQTLSADDLSRRVSYCLEEYRRALSQQRHTKYALYYDVRNMGPNLEKLDFLEDDGKTPEGRARLEDKLREWLEATSEIRYRKEGFFGKGGDAAQSAKDAAKYMLISDQVVIFASFHLDQASKQQDSRLLRLSFTVYRSDVHLTHLDESEKIPLPPSFELFASDRLDEIPREKFGDWRPIIQSVEKASGHSGDVASASMHFHRSLLLAKEQLKQFPVKMSKDRDGAYLKLDRAAYRKARRGNEFINLVLQIGRDDETFFVDAVEAWREEMRAGSAKLQFISKTKGRPVKFDLEVERTDERQIRVSDDDRLTETGRLVFSDFGGAAHASVLQATAIDDFIAKRHLFRHLDRPRNDAPVLMRAPVDYEQKYGEKTVSVIQNIKSGYPITALQGPPGSGKSTTIALLIADMLQEDETLRFLVTSQSHAAVDVTLEKVVAVTGALPGNVFSGDAPDAIRLLPARNSDRVSQHVRENYAIKAVVDKKLERIGKAAKEKLEAGNMKPLMEEAYRALQSAGTRSAFEIWSRLERHAPLVFGTTAASATARQMGGREEDFDVVIVDEAAKAFGIDLVQPLSIARHAIMVGDHKQLSPFDYEGSRRLFEKAREIYSNKDLDIRVPEEIAIISDDEENFNDALDWLTPFERFFERANEKADAVSTGSRPQSLNGPVPVAQMLTTQHRSFEPIGELVSNTFYGGQVRTAPNLKQEDYRDQLPWHPVIDGETRAPVIVWVDTSTLKKPVYDCNSRGVGRLFNTGEIDIVANVLEQCDLKSLGDEGLAPEERCKVMSPYAEQVWRLSAKLQGRPDLFDAEVAANLDRIVQTIDSSQGAESALVLVSMTRTGSVSLPRHKTAESYHMEMQRRLGFLTDPARMNVMFSRAMRQLVIVGRFSLFRSLDDLVQDWLAVTESAIEKRKLSEAYGFWGRLLNQFRSDDPGANIVRVDANRVEGLID